jgi:2-amino-4-hydroxy-6-hydroxymethyldihydropteridine diphosphokinase
MKNLALAVEFIGKIEGVSVVKSSGLYETEPWGGVEQGFFLNMVIEVYTSLKPIELLRQCQKIEHKLGRKRKIHWGPRVIDIDILTYEDLRINSEELTIPHPLMEQREFVLAPLREIAPAYQLPSGQTAEYSKGEGKVKKLSLK